MNVAELLTDWTENHSVLREERTRATDRSRVARLVAGLGDLDATELSAVQISQFVAEQLKDVRGWTVAGSLSILRAALKARGLPVPYRLGKTITAAQRHRQTETNGRDAWTREEARRLLSICREAQPYLYGPLRLALATGARRGAILALRWEDLDFERHRVHIRRTVTKGSRGTKLPKNGKACVAPLSPGLITVLRNIREVQLRESPGVAPTWVFPDPSRPSELWPEDNFGRRYASLARVMGCDGIRRLPFHCCRHTFITHALEAGFRAKRVADWVGASVSVIESTYSHVLDDDADVSFADHEE